MNGATYKPGIAVMVRTGPADEWHVGIVTAATDPRDGRTKAEARDRPNCSALSRWRDDCIRHATTDDLAALPDWARNWLDLALLDHNNPRVPAPAGPLRMALHGAGINRLSDLRAVSDAQLLALKGVGRKAVLQLREWQQAKECATTPEAG